MPHINQALWKMVLLPTGGAEFGQTGRSLGTIQPPLKELHNCRRTTEFEKLWPRKDAQADAERKHLLKKARRAGVDRAVIERLRTS